MEATNEMPHPYVPSDLNLPGYVPLVLSMPTILGVYGVASVLVVTFIWIISGTKNPPFPPFLGFCSNPIMVEKSPFLQLLIIDSVCDAIPKLALKGMLSVGWYWFVRWIDYPVNEKLCFCLSSFLGCSTIQMWLKNGSFLQRLVLHSTC